MVITAKVREEIKNLLLRYDRKYFNITLTGDDGIGYLVNLSCSKELGKTFIVVCSNPFIAFDHISYVRFSRRVTIDFNSETQELEIKIDH